MKKKGIVMDINKNKVGILTCGGEFIYVKNSSNPPSIGEIYESEEITKKSSLYKNIKKFSIIAASLLIVFLLSTFIRVYNLPISAVTIKINPSVKLEANRWNKIIRIIPLNKDGTHIIKDLKLKNKSLEKGITLILDEAKKENYINEDYKNSSKIISLDFTGITTKLNLSNIENHLKDLKVKYTIKTSEGSKINYNKDNKSIKDNKTNFNDNNTTDTNNGKSIKGNNNSSDEIKPKNPKHENRPDNKNKESNNSKNENNNSSNKNTIKTNENKKNTTEKKYNNNESTNNSKNMKDKKNNVIQKKDKKEKPSSQNENKETHKKENTKSK